MSVAQQVGSWAGRTGLRRKIAIALAAAALLSGIATYLALTGAPPFGPRPVVVLSLLNLDLVLLLALAALVAKRLAEVWAGRRRGLAGSPRSIRRRLSASMSSRPNWPPPPPRRRPQPRP